MADMALGGRLLVANPLLPDPNFDRTVVLVLVHTDDGALGVVLNRPTDTEVGVPLPQWEPLATEPAVVFVGGPVNHQAAVCLAQVAAELAAELDAGLDAGVDAGVDAGRDARESDQPLSPRWNPVAGDVGTLDLDGEPSDLTPELTALRVFAGYAGWGAGQLEGEIEAGAWWVVSTDAGDVFSADPGGLWKRILRRQGGDLALVAAYPDDPSMN